MASASEDEAETPEEEREASSEGPRRSGDPLERTRGLHRGTAAEHRTVTAPGSIASSGIEQSFSGE